MNEVNHFPLMFIKLENKVVHVRNFGGLLQALKKGWKEAHSNHHLTCHLRSNTVSIRLIPGMHTVQMQWIQ